MTEQEVTACQFRGARAMARLKMTELARKARVAPNTIVRIEAAKNVSPRSLAAVRGALEASGVQFLDRGVGLAAASGGDSVEVRLARVERMGRKIASQPVLVEGTREELLGYDEDGLPT